MFASYGQGRIEPLKAVRGHATSYSARTDGIVLKITFPVKHVKYGMVTDVRQNFGIETPAKRRKTISSPSTSSSPSSCLSYQCSRPESIAGCKPNIRCS